MIDTRKWKLWVSVLLVIAVICGLWLVSRSENRDERVADMEVYLNALPDKTLDVEVLVNEMYEDKFTDEALKQWLGMRFDEKWFPVSEEELEKYQKGWGLNVRDIEMAMYKLAESDPKWVLWFYYEKFLGVGTLAATGSDDKVDDSWLPAKRPPRDIDQFLVAIMQGWAASGDGRYDDWVDLMIEKHSLIQPENRRTFLDKIGPKLDKIWRR